MTDYQWIMMPAGKAAVSLSLSTNLNNEVWPEGALKHFLSTLKKCCLSWGFCKHLGWIILNCVQHGVHSLVFKNEWKSLALFQSCRQPRSKQSQQVLAYFFIARTFSVIVLLLILVEQTKAMPILKKNEVLHVCFDRRSVVVWLMFRFLLYSWSGTQHTEHPW